MKNVLAGWDEPVQIEKTRNDKQFNWASSVFTLDFQYITEGKTCKRPVILVAESIGNSSRALNDPKRLPPPKNRRQLQFMAKKCWAELWDEEGIQPKRRAMKL